MGDDSATDYQLSAGERRLVEQMRRMMSDKKSGPHIVTVYMVDGIWQIWQGQKGGTVKDIDK